MVEVFEWQGGSACIRLHMVRRGCLERCEDVVDLDERVDDELGVGERQVVAEPLCAPGGPPAEADRTQQ